MAIRRMLGALAAAVLCQRTDRNVAVDAKHTGHPRAGFTPFDSWEEVEGVA